MESTRLGKICQNKKELNLPNNILNHNSKTAEETLKVMGFEIEQGMPVLKNDEEW